MVVGSWFCFVIRLGVFGPQVASKHFLLKGNVVGDVVILGFASRKKVEGEDGQ